jgi:copper oxidase (laccase) domain-containing protein
VSADEVSATTGAFGARWVMSNASDGDVRPARAGALLIQQRLAGVPWSSSRQVHGSNVIEIGRVHGAMDVEADGIVTSAAHTPIAMFGADCALIAFASREGPIGIAHAGWKGLTEGVIGATVSALRSLGAMEIHAATSAMIHPECYEFSPDDLDAATAAFGEQLRATTADGRPAFDLPSGVGEALRRAGVETVTSLGGCTACEGDWFSFRARRDEARHGLVCWTEGS